MNITNALKAFFDSEEQAVSPVIGVILMVAITVILAAVIGTFVLGLGDEVQTTAPNAQFSFDQGDFNDDGNAPDIEVSHEGGDSIDVERLTITVDGTEPDFDGTIGDEWTGEVSAGDTSVIGNDDTSVTPSSDETVRVVWESADGSSSQVLAEYEVN